MGIFIFSVRLSRTATSQDDPMAALCLPPGRRITPLNINPEMLVSMVQAICHPLGARMHDAFIILAILVVDDIMAYGSLESTSRWFKVVLVVAIRMAYFLRKY